jgi:predicted small metal-binding protein
VKESSLAKSFQCRDAGVRCRGRFTGETVDEVFGKAVEHAHQKHGVDLTQARTLASYARGLIRDEGGSTAERPAGGR